MADNETEKEAEKAVEQGLEDVAKAATEVADAAAVIHSHDVVGMGMRDEDGIQIAEFLTEHLGPEIWSGVDDQSNRRRLDVNRGAQSVIPRVGQKGLRILLSDDGNPLRGACAQEAECERHYQRLRVVSL